MRLSGKCAAVSYLLPRDFFLPGVAVHPYHVEPEVGSSHEERYCEKHLALFPTHGLLVPEARYYAQQREHKAETVERGVSAAVLYAVFEAAVFHSVGSVYVKAYYHPHNEANPGIGRQENHKAKARYYSEYRHERHERHAEGALDVGHCLAEYYDGRANERERKERAYARHLARHLRGDERRQSCHHAHEQHVAVYGCAETGIDLREERGQQTVAAHAEEHAALRHERYHYHRAVAYQYGQHYGVVEPRVGRLNHARGVGRADVLYGHRHGGYALQSAELLVVGNACHHVTEGYVQHRHHEQRAQNAYGHVAAGILALLCRRAHGVEAEKGERHHGRAAQNAREAELAHCARVLGYERVVVGRVDVFPAQHHEHYDDGNLYHHYYVVHNGAFLDAADEEQAHNHHYRGRGQVDNAAVPGAGAQFVRQRDAHALEQHHGIAAPAYAHRRGGHGVLQHEVPAYHPRHELAHGGVRIRVRAARHGDNRRELRITQRRKTAAQRREHKGNYHGRTAVFGSYQAGDGKQTRAHYHAYSEGYEAYRAEHAAQRLAARLGRLGLEHGYRFTDK